MIKQSKGKIFLADERGENHASWFRSRHTFNFGNYFNIHKEAFGALYMVSDDELDANRELPLLLSGFSCLLLLPLAGAIGYNDSYGNENIIAAGQLQVTGSAASGMAVIRNPFEEGIVNFLQVRIKTAGLQPSIGPCLSTYDVNEYPNEMKQVSLGESFPFIISIGKFCGRGETVYLPSKINAGLFLFVIEGAFEIAGRLLHARDSLALWETGEVEIEALSNDALLVAIELSLH